MTHIRFKSNQQVQPTQLTSDILSIICILTHLVHHSPLDTPIHLYVRSAIIKRKLQLASREIISPKQTYAVEWDLLQSANKLIQQIGQTKIQLHISKSNLSSQQTTPTKLHQGTFSNSEVTLFIGNKRVANNYTSIIRDAHTTKEVFQFYSTKYNWNINTIQNIHWDAHGKAITALSGRHYKSTCQLIHRWLPVNLSYSKQSVGTAKLCPYCTTEREHQYHTSYPLHQFQNRHC
jgi:hypothetical protein